MAASKPKEITVGEKVFTSRKCKLCNVQIIFATNPATGAPVPLDVSSVAYTIEHNADGELVISGRAAAFVSHYRTCPKDFGK